MSGYLNTADSDDEADSETLAQTSEEEKLAGKGKSAASKADGDEKFRSKDYNGALEAYTSAINALKSAGLPPDAVILSNRSATYLLLKRYVPACHDAALSAKADPTNWKGNILLLIE